MIRMTRHAAIDYSAAYEYRNFPAGPEHDEAIWTAYKCNYWSLRAYLESSLDLAEEEFSTLKATLEAKPADEPWLDRYAEQWRSSLFRRAAAYRLERGPCDMEKANNVDITESL